uniref:MYND-type domain-containing protein n=1 Tax=Branchiostoma floridae TaxID=7739 RepID=C3ZC00_BRAFL|eukprot:XP_002593930.1 hypothetical protein BRAFLDRAFT_98229 [Branchiostoma floridae]
MSRSIMDSRPGTCWRCGGDATMSCPRCELAQYCRDHCMQLDIYRHEVECTNCAVAQACSLPSCEALTREAKPCSACQEAWYCSPTCQRSDWARHKGTCNQQTRYIRQAATNIAARLAADQRKKNKDAGLSTTYYWGNTVAVDLLQLSQNEGSHGNDCCGDDFNLLLLGTGSMRHVVLTVAELPEVFTGNLNFVLNDNDYQVMARNVLMLYALWRYGDKEDVAMDITQIWYSVLISKEQTEMVRICLEDLLNVECDGDEAVVLCTGLITVSSGHFATLKKMWKTWLKLLNEAGTRKSITKEFQTIYWKRLKGFPKEPRMGVESHLLRLPERYRTSVRDWYEHGILLSESDERRRHAGNDNVTLMSSNTRMANFLTKMTNAMNGNSKAPSTIPFPELTLGLQSDSTPFGAWDCLSVRGFYDDDCALQMYSVYISDKISRLQEIVQKGKIKVMFVLSDCLEVPQHIPEGMVFDRIHSSNLADYRATLGQTDAAVFLPQESLLEKLEGTARQDIAALRGGMTKELDTDLTTVLHVLRGRKILMEYFDNWVSFMWYLRAELLARTSPSSVLDVNTNGINGINNPGGCAKVPKMNEVSTACGMKLRNFSKDANKICPFKPRVNAKPISDPNVYLRVLEWTL